MSLGLLNTAVVFSYYSGTGTEEYDRLLTKASTKGQEGAAFAARRAYLDQLAGAVIRCSAVILPDMLVQENYGQPFAKRNIQISQSVVENKVIGNVWVEITDKGNPDFYILDICAKRGYHIQLDPTSENVMNIPLNSLTYFNETGLKYKRSSLWNNCVVMAMSGTFWVKST